jgi:hypothetical protein
VLHADGEQDHVGQRVALALVEAAAREEVVESFPRAIGDSRLVARAVGADGLQRLVHVLAIVVHHQDSRSVQRVHVRPPRLL